MVINFTVREIIIYKKILIPIFFHSCSSLTNYASIDSYFYFYGKIFFYIFFLLFQPFGINVLPISIFKISKMLALNYLSIVMKLGD
jgi:hypothetical protein